MASGEIIVAAGPGKSAQILQVSGVGPKKLLNEIGVDLVAELPVGEGFQDHTTLSLGYNCEFLLMLRVVQDL
jgi:choline dehydrogenase